MSTTAQHSLITVVADGAPLGVFDSRSGGETSAEVSKRRGGGMGREKTYPGLGTNGDLTVTRGYDRGRDHELIRKLRGRVGRARVSVSEKILDEDGAPWGQPTTWVGVLSGVNPGDADSESAEPRVLELTVVVDGVS